MSKDSKNKEKKVKPTKQTKGKSSFTRDTRAELKKVIWPNTKQLINNTAAVISIVVIIGLIVFVLDVCLDKVNSYGIDKLKSAVQSNQDTNVIGDSSSLNDLNLTGDEGAEAEVISDDSETQEEVDPEEE